MSNKKIFLVGLFIIIIFIILFSTFYLNKHFEKNNSINYLKLRIADLPVTESLPLYVAIEKGYFKEEGIDVEIVRMDSPNLIIDAVLSGKVDMVSTGGALGIAAIAEQKNPNTLRIFAVAGGDDKVPIEGLMVKINSSIKTVQDLKGKKVGTIPGIQWRTISKQILNSYGLDTNDINLIEIAPGLQAQALASGSVDAILSLEVTPTIIRQTGIGKDLITAPATKTISNPFYTGAGIISVEFVEQNPELTNKVFSIFDRAIDDINNDYESTKPFLLKHTSINEEIVRYAPKPKVKMIKDLTSEDMVAVDKFYNMFFAQSVVEMPLNFSRMTIK